MTHVCSMYMSAAQWKLLNQWHIIAMSCCTAYSTGNYCCALCNVLQCGSVVKSTVADPTFLGSSLLKTKISQVSAALRLRRFCCPHTLDTIPKYGPVPNKTNSLWDGGDTRWSREFRSQLVGIHQFNIPTAVYATYLQDKLFAIMKTQATQQGYKYHGNNSALNIQCIV